jgi:hypothetical protein
MKPRWRPSPSDWGRQNDEGPPAGRAFVMLVRNWWS